MSVTVKLKQIEADKIFKNNQTGTVLYTLEDLYKIYVYQQARDEFYKWSGRTVHIKGQGRTKEYNNKVGGNANSNHLFSLGTDTYFEGVTFDKARFIKYAKKWKEISSKYKFIGEIGWYPEYTFEGCKGMLHIGGFIKYSSTFYHWVTKDGVQKNMLYKNEI